MQELQLPTIVVLSPDGARACDELPGWEWFEDPATVLTIRGPHDASGWRTVLGRIHELCRLVNAEFPGQFSFERVTTSGGRPKQRDP